MFAQNAFVSDGLTKKQTDNAPTLKPFLISLIFLLITLYNFSFAIVLFDLFPVVSSFILSKNKSKAPLILDRE